MRKLQRTIALSLIAFLVLSIVYTNSALADSSSIKGASVEITTAIDKTVVPTPSRVLRSDQAMLTALSGSGNEDSPYLISTKEELNEVRNHLSSYFRLENDIEFTAADFAEHGAFYNGGAGFIPIGEAQSTPFTGVFDGNGYAIKGLYQNIISDNSEIYGGLFGFVLNGTIQELGFEESNIRVDTIDSSSHACAGGIVGSASIGSIIANCYNTGNVSSSSSESSTIGGIAGTVLGSTISNCHNSGTVSGNSYRCGGISGSVGSSTLNNCYNTGNICGNAYAGGITGGLTNSTISNCYNSGNINCNFFSGGITGEAHDGATVSRCYNVGNVIANDSAGGIAAYISTNSMISYCYNTGDVGRIGNSWSYGNVGGIVGYLEDSVTSNCYNTGSVTNCYTRAGGIVGNVMDNSTVSVCYNIGSVNSIDGNAGGIAGDISQANNHPINNCYYLNRILKGIGTGTDTSSTIKITSMQLSQQSTFSGFDFDTIWTIAEHSNYPYPQLKGMTHVEVVRSTEGFVGGNGNPHTPYQIATTEQLNNIRNYLDAYFILINNIGFPEEDFKENGDYYNNGAGFIPIGTPSSPFIGELDGNGYVINSLYQNISSSSSIYGGLFGYIDNGTIQNLRMEESDISTNNTSDGTARHCYVGGMVGYMHSGTISNCRNLGNVSGDNPKHNSYAGGIVGYVDSSTVRNCNNSGNVTSNSYDGSCYAGGIAGYVYYGGTVIDCYNMGTIDGINSNAGGINGHISNSIISNCYNLGIVKGSYSGGIAGEAFSDSTISNCYNTGMMDSYNMAGGIVGTLGYNMYN